MGIDIAEKIACLETLKKEKEDVLAFHLSEKGVSVFYEKYERDEIMQGIYDSVSIELTTQISCLAEVIEMLKGEETESNAVD